MASSFYILETDLAGRYLTEDGLSYYLQETTTANTTWTPVAAATTTWVPV